MGGADVGGSKETKAEPNVVPLCDILLVLLIIFMVVTPLIKKGINVRLPEAAHTQDQPEPGNMITVYVKDDGSVFLDEEEVTDLGKLAVMIEDRMEEKKQAEKTKLLLKADEDILYGRVTVVMDEIRRAQIEIVGLVTQEKVASE
ncbi:MAG: biopolymer transporter ExbD [Candidatus Aminicenantes bacterium]|nr:MAG: biopolymer transporter ExbD [Candidatus Aminicenantes bacterium]